MKDGQILVQVTVREPEPPVPQEKERVGPEIMSSTLSWGFTIPKTHSRRFHYVIRQGDEKKVTEVFNAIEDMLDEQFGPPKWKEAHRKNTWRTE